MIPVQLQANISPIDNINTYWEIKQKKAKLIVENQKTFYSISVSQILFVDNGTTISSRSKVVTKEEFAHIFIWCSRPLTSRFKSYQLILYDDTGKIITDETTLETIANNICRVYGSIVCENPIKQLRDELITLHGSTDIDKYHAMVPVASPALNMRQAN